MADRDRCGEHAVQRQRCRRDAAHLGDDEIPGADESGEVHETQGGQQVEPPHRHLVHEGVKKLGTAGQHAHRVNDQLQHTHTHTK